MKMTFKSYADKINKDLDKQEKLSREKAAKHLASTLKKDVRTMFGDGDLLKGSGAIERLKYKTRVGFKKPAYHAHLVEFGTGERFINNYRGKKGIRVSSGEMPSNPFFEEFLNRESNKTFEIMGQAFVKGFD